MSIAAVQFARIQKMSY